MNTIFVFKNIGVRRVYCSKFYFKINTSKIIINLVQFLFDFRWWKFLNIHSAPTSPWSFSSKMKYFFPLHKFKKWHSKHFIIVYWCIYCRIINITFPCILDNNIITIHYIIKFKINIIIILISFIISQFTNTFPSF